ncbi:MAG: hypothetical protein IJF78_16005 [Clostridia bacterium]|nr:hypothetical protein [Clostridia bacterium]
MNHITVGKVRGKSKKEEPVRERDGSRFGEDAVTAIGLCAVCLMLLVPVSRDTAPQSDAVAVMSTNAGEYREVLQEIDEPASAASAEDSVFDYIGRMFAGLLFGE